MNILKKIERASVFSISLNPAKDSLTIGEDCDYYYTINLNKLEVDSLIQELKEIHKEMI